MSTLLLGLALLGILLGSVAQAATGMGFSLVAAPVMIMALGPREGIAATLVLAASSSVVPLLRDGRHGQPRTVAGLLVPTLACTPGFIWLVRDVDVTWLAVAGGLGVIVSVLLLASGLRSERLGTPQAAVVAGAASAGLTVVGGAGGPAIGLYAANAGWEPRVQRANLHWYFFIQNVTTAALLGVHLPDPVHLATLCAGTVVGMLAADRLSPGAVRSAVLGLSLLGGAGLLATAW